MSQVIQVRFPVLQKTSGAIPNSRLGLVRVTITTEIMTLEQSRAVLVRLSQIPVAFFYTRVLRLGRQIQIQIQISKINSILSEINAQSRRDQCGIHIVDINIWGVEATSSVLIVASNTTLDLEIQIESQISNTTISIQSKSRYRSEARLRKQGIISRSSSQIYFKDQIPTKWSYS